MLELCFRSTEKEAAQTGRLGADRERRLSEHIPFKMSLGGTGLQFRQVYVK